MRRAAIGLRCRTNVFDITDGGHAPPRAAYSPSCVAFALLFVLQLHRRGRGRLSALATPVHAAFCYRSCGVEPTPPHSAQRPRAASCGLLAVLSCIASSVCVATAPQVTGANRVWQPPDRLAVCVATFVCFGEQQRRAAKALLLKRIASRFVSSVEMSALRGRGGAEFGAFRRCFLRSGALRECYLGPRCAKHAERVFLERRAST